MEMERGGAKVRTTKENKKRHLLQFFLLQVQCEATLCCTFGECLILSVCLTLALCCFISFAVQSMLHLRWFSLFLVLFCPQLSLFFSKKLIEVTFFVLCLH